jgi:hypothetical protein
MTPSQTLASSAEKPQSVQEQRGSTFGVVAIILSALFLAGVFAVMARKKEI